MERITPTTTWLGRLLDWCGTQAGTGLHPQPDQRYSIRVEGKLLCIPLDQFPAPGAEEDGTVRSSAAEIEITDFGSCTVFWCLDR